MQRHLSQVKRYAVHSMFLTVQGEGYHVGRRAVFVRMAGCNVWSGRENGRVHGTSACSLVCDTKFVGTHPGIGGGRMTASEIVFAVRNVWGLDTAPFVVVTGGEPTLQLDAHLVDELHVQLGATVALETNGSLPFPDAVDWVCVSPKPPVAVAVTRVDEVKVLYPLFDPLSYENLAPIRTVQPVDGDPGSLQKCIDFVLKHPGWKLGLQCHKVWGVQ